MMNTYSLKNILIFSSAIALFPFISTAQQSVGNQDSLTEQYNQGQIEAANIRREVQERLQQTIPNPNMMREGDMTQNRANNAAQMQAQRQTTLQERAQARLGRLTENMERRLTFTINRLWNIIARIESRIEKIDERNIDTTLAKSTLAEAKRTLQQAEVSLTTIKSNLPNFVSSTSPQDTWSQTRNNIQLIHQDIKSAHASIREVIVLLNQAVSESREEV
jgi:hypothetical protein